jgi:hypothetical protein
MMSSLRFLFLNRSGENFFGEGKTRQELDGIHE